MLCSMFEREDFDFVSTGGGDNYYDRERRDGKGSEARKGKLYNILLWEDRKSKKVRGKEGKRDHPS